MAASGPRRTSEVFPDRPTGYSASLVFRNTSSNPKPLALGLAVGEVEANIGCQIYGGTTILTCQFCIPELRDPPFPQPADTPACLGRSERKLHDLRRLRATRRMEGLGMSWVHVIFIQFEASASRWTRTAGACSTKQNQKPCTTYIYIYIYIMYTIVYIYVSIT